MSAMRADETTAALLRANRELWDGWTELHVPSEFYDVEGFRAGLRITSLREYPYLSWKWFPWMVEAGNGSYRLPDGMPQIPLMFSLTATKPEDGPAGAAAAEVAPPDGAGLP